MFIINPYRFVVPSGVVPPVETPWLHLDGSDLASMELVGATGQISKWKDQTLETRFFTQSTATKYPITASNYQNGLGAVYADGINDTMWMDEIIGNVEVGSSLTIFVVVNPDIKDYGGIVSIRPTSAAQGFSWRYNNAAELNYFHTGKTGTSAYAVTDQLNIIMIRRNDNDLERGINGVVYPVTSSTGYNPRGDDLTHILAENDGGGSFFKGHLCEFRIYSSSLSDAHVADVFDELNTKWAVY